MKLDMYLEREIKEYCELNHLTYDNFLVECIKGGFNFEKSGLSFTTDNGEIIKSYESEINNMSLDLRSCREKYAQLEVELQNKYELGKRDANKELANKHEKEIVNINSDYEDKIDELNDTIEKLNGDITTLENKISKHDTILKEKNVIINNLQEQINVKKKENNKLDNDRFTFAPKNLNENE